MQFGVKLQMQLCHGIQIPFPTYVLGFITKFTLITNANLIKIMKI